MTRVLLKMALLPTLLFVAVIGIIRAQPYDDHGLREFLTPPDGCPAPCFMGIRPGVTTIEGALSIVQNHLWVEDATLVDGVIHWRWSDSLPDFVYHEFGLPTIYQDSNNRISALTFESSITIGDLWLSLRNTIFIHYFPFYQHDDYFYIWRRDGNCVRNPREYLETKVGIQLYASDNIDFGGGPLCGDV